MRVEHEYERGGALQYLAAWDVRRGRVLGRCEDKTGIDSFGRLVDQVMCSEPYRSASRVFWVVDNGSSHRGQAAIWRLRKAYRKAVLVHTPVHASWLNQVEIYFSIIQRKVLTPNDFASLEEVEQRLRLHEELSNREPRPFEWKFDRAGNRGLSVGRLCALQGSAPTTGHYRKFTRGPGGSSLNSSCVEWIGRLETRDLWFTSLEVRLPRHPEFPCRWSRAFRMTVRSTPICLRHRAWSVVLSTKRSWSRTAGASRTV